VKLGHGLLLLLASTAFAGAVAANEEQPVGVEWEWGVKAGLGYFNFRDSLFLQTEPDPPGNLSDDWGEFFVKPWATVNWNLEYGALFGGASWVWAKTGEDASEISGGGASSSDLDELYLGWSSGQGMDDGWLIGGGRYPYVLANQFLISDGFADGGSRAGYWSNPRIAWKRGLVVAYEDGASGYGVFHIQRDEHLESDTETKITGINADWETSDQSWLFGATWMDLEANELAPQRDGAKVWNLRIYTTPFDFPLTIETEWVDEDNDLALQASAAYLQVYYTFQDLPWQPVLYYRYAWFEGDNPDTPANENYDPLFPGFQDWGSWWQGEIAGEYFISNSNLISQMLRLHTSPRSNISTGLLYFDFKLDQPGSFQGGVLSDQLAREINWYLDWKASRLFSMSFVLARNNPGKAAEEAFDRTKDFKYGMAYLNFSY
jgi:hypothetical protein